MLKKSDIENALNRLNDALAKKDMKGEVCLYGGAVMCLVYDARPSTKDVDAIFFPTEELRKLISQVGEELKLGDHWLNDGVKGFVVDHPRRVLFQKSNLHVLVPEPDYLLAMKVLAARADTSDAEDVRFLIKKLGLTKPAEVFRILEQYYPKSRVRPATQFFVEEILGS
ncbi:MAG: hypothetical protein IPN90_11250 [Elusimicrobia bacterium]|nr:hypothetical protein [Elusimicrobiota bacterium]